MFGSRVRLFDPAISMVAALANSGVDLGTFAAAWDADQHAALARAIVALDALDIDSLSGLTDRGLVSLVEPLTRDEIGTGWSIELFLERFRGARAAISVAVAGRSGWGDAWLHLPGGVIVWQDETLSMRRMGVVCRVLFGDRPGRLLRARGISHWMRALACLDPWPLLRLFRGSPRLSVGRS